MCLSCKELYFCQNSVYILKEKKPFFVNIISHFFQIADEFGPSDGNDIIYTQTQIDSIAEQG